MNQITINLKPMTGEPSREARKAYLTGLAQAGGAASEWARHELTVLNGRPVSPLERRKNGLAAISAGNSLWYNDLSKTIEALYKMKEDIQNHGNLELYLADDYPREYYEAIQRSSFVKISRTTI